MSVAPINSLNEFQSLIKSGNVVVIDFWATWCGPCKAISPVFEDLAKRFPGLRFHKVDVDQQEAISQEVGIRAMPTFAVYKDGEKVDELVGANPTGLETLLQKAQSFA